MPGALAETITKLLNFNLSIMRLLFFFLCPILSFAQTNFEKKTFLEKVEILIPKELTKMTDEAWKTKYHDFPKPAAALSDENGEVNLLIDLTQQPAKEVQLQAYKDMRASNLKKRGDVTILEEGVKEFNGKKVSFIKFSSKAVDQEVFNYYVFTILDGKILGFTFNCINSLKNEWEKAAEKMFNSLSIK